MKAMTAIAKKKGFLSENGQSLKQGQWLQHFLLSIATTGTVACFAFLWNLNKSMAVMEQQSIEMNKSLDEIKLKINNIQLDVRDVRERVIKLETLNQK